MSHIKIVSRAVLACRRGAVLIEAAITLPVLLFMLFGIVSCGTYLALCHAVQQSANEAARSTLAGLSPSERSTIASQTASTTLDASVVGAGKGVSVVTLDDGQTLTVTVRYDASANPLLSVLSMPRSLSMIERSASVRLAGL